MSAGLDTQRQTVENEYLDLPLPAGSERVLWKKSEHRITKIGS